MAGGQMDSFSYVSYSQDVIFGPGSLARLPGEVEQFGWQRLMLCTSRSQRANGRADSVEGLLGDRLVAAYDRVQPHVPDTQVAEALSLAQENEVQAIVGLGGGSSHRDGQGSRRRA